MKPVAYCVYWGGTALMFHAVFPNRNASYRMVKAWELCGFVATEVPLAECLQAWRKSLAEYDNQDGGTVS